MAMKRTVLVSEVVQYEVEVDTAEPKWSWLDEFDTDDDKLKVLREDANTTDGAFGNDQCPPGAAIAAWREIEWRF